MAEFCSFNHHAWPRATARGVSQRPGLIQSSRHGAAHVLRVTSWVHLGRASRQAYSLFIVLQELPPPSPCVSYPSLQSSCPQQAAPKQGAAARPGSGVLIPASTYRQAQLSQSMSECEVRAGQAPMERPTVERRAGWIWLTRKMWTRWERTDGGWVRSQRSQWGGGRYPGSVGAAGMGPPASSQRKEKPQGFVA